MSILRALRRQGIRVRLIRLVPSSSPLLQNWESLVSTQRQKYRRLKFMLRRFLYFYFVLTQMLYNALCLLYHSITEAVLFACLSSGCATTTSRLLGPKVGNSIKCLSQGHSDALPHRKSNQGFYSLLVCYSLLGNIYYRLS